jgi:hypothetical protein
VKFFAGLTLFPVVLLLMLLVGCSTNGEDRFIGQREPYSLHQIENCDELLDVYRRGTLSNPAHYVPQDPRDDGWDPPPDSDPHHLIRSTWQRLNTRLSGVEESDLIKTDGTYIFSMTIRSLVVSKPVSGSGVELIANLALDAPDKYVEPNIYVSPHKPVRSELILHQQTLLVIRSWHKFSTNDGLHGDSVVQIFEIDVSDPNHPLIVRELELSNTELLAAWFFDNQVLVALWHFAPVTALRSSWQMEHESDPEAAARSYNEALVGELDISHWQPWYRLREGSYGAARKGSAIACEDTHLPTREYWQPHSTYVMNFDLSEGIGAWHSTAILADYYRVHANANRLYFFGSVLYPERNAQIYQFELNAEAAPDYRAARFLQGDLPRGPALDEYEGSLRVAYNGLNPDTEQWGGHVETLQLNGSGQGDEILEASGSVFVGEEEIRYVRWLGEVAYVSPWIGYEEETRPDPLHVLNLSNPEQPEIASTVDLPELSRNYYIRAESYVPAWPRGDLLQLDDTLGIAIGFASGVYEYTPDQTQAALIDMSDPLSPRLINVISFSGPSSAVEFDERAALLSDDDMWLAGSGCFSEELCQSAFVGLRLTADGLKQRHTLWFGGESLGPPGVRAVMLGGQLHLVSGMEIRTFDPDSGAEIGSLSLW